MRCCPLSSEDNMQESVLSFPPVSPGVQTQLTKLGGKHVYLLSHLIGPVFV